MKFDEQVKEAKIKKLKYRILRDVTFIILGIIFFSISVLIEVKKQNDKPKASKKTTIKQMKTYLK